MKKDQKSWKQIYQSIPWANIYWPTTLFLILTPLASLIFLPLYFIYVGIPMGVLVMTLIFAGLTNLSITAGYHRLMSHRSYEAHPLVRAIFLLIGASAWQGSALKWSADHRRHHSKVDSDEDPYSISKGFWYAHMGWLFLKNSVDQKPEAPDLEKDWMIRFQHDHYIAIAILMSFGLPMAIGYGMGAPWAGLMIGGALRVVLTQQSTFLVNSLSHTLGKQTYSEDVSARDSLLVAFLTHGEGYHNFHHKFQIDYRNGIRWYQWDPTKWTIRALYLLGLAKKLRKISEVEILKARLQMDEFRLKSKGFSAEKVEKIRNQILGAQATMKAMAEEMKKIKKGVSSSSQQHLNQQLVQKLNQIRLDWQLARLEFKSGLQQWKCLVRSHRE